MKRAMGVRTVRSAAHHRVAALCSALALVAATWGAVQAQGTSFTVTNLGMTAYTINGQLNPTLTLARGQTYTFAVNAPTNHQFWIKTARVTGTGSSFDNGVTNNGTLNGTLTFQVPSDAPSPLFYQCQTHTGMGGTIEIVAASVPALGGQLWLWIAGMVGAVACAWLVLGARARD